MATKVHILPEQLTNKIAAGEVVERPSSVVKELLENALDAGCTDVCIEIESGGKKLIRVTDDGCGMCREDALLALERHATSKIGSDADLFTLTSLGFRGEALPSIASVSRFRVATREKGRIEGTEIYAEGGRIKEVKACGMSEGTVMEVRNLFFNTPARLKFMKSVETETGHVGELVTRLALSRPETRFTYISDGKTIFRLLPGDLRSRAAAVLGVDLGKSLHPVNYSAEGVVVTGLVSRPDCHRSSGNGLYTYINGRFIRDKVVHHAILQGYRNFLERGRYPVVVLSLQVPPAEVDVNVHPTKHEVRFREQGRVHDAIQAAMTRVLSASPWRQPAAPVTAMPPVRPAAASAPEMPVSEVRTNEVREILSEYRPPSPRNESFGFSPVPAREPVAVPREPAVAAPAAAAGPFSSLSVIGQFNASYLLCQDGTDLVIVDQHAAHERVAFEKLKQQYAGQGVQIQGLLFPETVELSFSEGAVLKENLEQILRLGFDLEPFGGTTWVLKGIPHLLKGGDHLRLLRDLLEELGTLGRSRTFSDALEELLIRIACHSVIRGQRPLGREEMAALLSLMDESPFADTCPHGRPVFRTISLNEVEKMFKRK